MLSGGNQISFWVPSLIVYSGTKNVFSGSHLVSASATKYLGTSSSRNVNLHGSFNYMKDLEQSEGRHTKQGLLSRKRLN